MEQRSDPIPVLTRFPGHSAFLWSPLPGSPLLSSKPRPSLRTESGKPRRDAGEGQALKKGVGKKAFPGNSVGRPRPGVPHLPSAPTSKRTMEKNQETGLTCRVGKPMLWTELRPPESLSGSPNPHFLRCKCVWRQAFKEVIKLKGSPEGGR